MEGLPEIPSHPHPKGPPAWLKLSLAGTVGVGVLVVLPPTAWHFEQEAGSADHVVGLVQQGATPAEIIADQQAVAEHKHDAAISAIGWTCVGLAASSGLAVGATLARRRRQHPSG